MSRLRDAAALLIESGRAIGAAAQAVAIVTVLEQILATEPSRVEPAMQAALADARRARAKLDHDAALMRARAEDLIREIEHPGAALARRLLATYRGARAAWRGSR